MEQRHAPAARHARPRRAALARCRRRLRCAADRLGALLQAGAAPCRRCPLARAAAWARPCLDSCPALPCLPCVCRQLGSGWLAKRRLLVPRSLRRQPAHGARCLQRHGRPQRGCGPAGERRLRPSPACASALWTGRLPACACIQSWRFALPPQVAYTGILLSDAAGSPDQLWAVLYDARDGSWWRYPSADLRGCATPSPGAAQHPATCLFLGFRVCHPWHKTARNPPPSAQLSTEILRPGPRGTAGCAASGGRAEEGAACLDDADCCAGMRCKPRLTLPWAPGTPALLKATTNASEASFPVDSPGADGLAALPNECTPLGNAALWMSWSSNTTADVAAGGTVACPELLDSTWKVPAGAQLWGEPCAAAGVAFEQRRAACWRTFGAAGRALLCALLLGHSAACASADLPATPTLAAWLPPVGASPPQPIPSTKDVPLADWTAQQCGDRAGAGPALVRGLLAGGESAARAFNASLFRCPDGQLLRQRLADQINPPALTQPAVDQVLRCGAGSCLEGAGLRGRACPSARLPPTSSHVQCTLYQLARGKSDLPGGACASGLTAAPPLLCPPARRPRSVVEAYIKAADSLGVPTCVSLSMRDTRGGAPLSLVQRHTPWVEPADGSASGNATEAAVAEGGSGGGASTGAIVGGVVGGLAALAAGKPSTGCALQLSWAA